MTIVLVAAQQMRSLCLHESDACVCTLREEADLLVLHSCYNINLDDNSIRKDQ